MKEMIVMYDDIVILNNMLIQLTTNEENDSNV